MHKSDIKTRLFQEFPPVTFIEWMQKIEEDLKGNSFEKLIWKYADKIHLNPFYREEDLKGLEYLDADSGSFPFVRNSKTKLNEWKLRQDIEVTDVAYANKKAVDAIERGANSINFKISENLHLTYGDFKLLLNDLYGICPHIHFKASGNETSVLDHLLKFIKENNIEPDEIYGSIISDPLGDLASVGRFRQNEKDDFDLLVKLIITAGKNLPNFKFTGINGSIFHNAGGSLIQELAFSLAIASEYLEKFTAKGLTVDQAAGSFLLNLSVGPLYFMEIAKFRAARILFAFLVKAWNPENDSSADITIHAETSEWNQTVSEPYNNILRGTTESMSAILGGTDSLTVVPFDKPSGNGTIFSERIARNTQIILKEEAFFDKVIDPAAGSYYIEKITDTIAENAWKLFLSIEKKGGFTEAFISGIIQDMINENSGQRNDNIANKKEILIGVNHYPDSSGKHLEECTCRKESHKIDSQNLLARPLRQYRGASAFEELRSGALSAGTIRPKVFLLPFGDPSWRTARATFASNFFGCAGYEIIENSGFSSIKEGVEAALSSGSSVVVLCSSDDEYPVIAPEAKKMLGDKAILVIAGYPKEFVDGLISEGIVHFIHIKSNVLEELRKFHKLLGIK